MKDNRIIGMLFDRIGLLSEIGHLRYELQEMATYADKLADGLPMLPKDVEVIRQANWSLAEENNKLQAERDEARDWARRMKRDRDALRDLLGMMDVDKIAENLEKMRRWLK